MQDYSRHLAWGEDYGITLEVDGRSRQFAQLSGGEQMSAALSVRLALLREMSNIDVAFFTNRPPTWMKHAAVRWCAKFWRSRGSVNFS